MACALAMTVLPASAAQTNYCQRLVGYNQCGKYLYWTTTGRSITYYDYHEYGGILGMGQSKCNYQYYYSYLERKCLDGHVAEASTLKNESGHTCGK